LPYKIGFIGAGQMALALAKGFMASGLLAPSQVWFLAAK
jgi:pyrroline-5-carboxylate reductase